MKILFTTRKRNLFSKLVRWGTDSDISHVAIEFDNIIIHATKSGVDLDYKTTFLKKNIIVYQVEKEYKNEKELMDKLFSKYEGSCYDYGAVLYLVIYYLLKKTLNYTIPGRNKWANSKDYMCVELAKDLFPELELEMVTPIELYNIIKKDKSWIVVYGAD